MSKAARKSTAKAKGSEPAEKKPATPPVLEKAVEEFASGVRSFQRADFTKAADQFKEILGRYPRELEICDRARAYLAACDRHRQAESRAPRLRDAEDHYNHGIFQLNRGDFEEASRLFEKALSLNPGNEKALYGRACAFALEGREDEALDALREAIQANPGNRVLARHDADLISLRPHPVFQSLLRGAGDGEA